VDTDRLPEEKSRGITIELGFAPLDLGEGVELSVVDVPGHEGLVRTMVAGASGIDLLLLVVAADEGVMPQTREHLAICNLLGLSRGVVALTKIDLADEDVAELAEAEVRELLEPTSLGEAPILRVSSRSGEGVDALRDALTEAARAARARTPRSGPPRLFVDRLFEARGFGSIVTGSLIGAPLRVGESVEIHPLGKQARVRGLQSFGEKADEVQPGARCAVNLQGVPLGELERGQLLTAPDALHPTRTLDVQLDWLAGAPELDREPTSVEFLTGTSERRARVALIGAERLQGGGSGFARIHLDGAPLALLPGDRFVLRGFHRMAQSGSTLGGGGVLDVDPPRRRRSDPALAAELARLVEAGDEEGVLARIERAGFAGRGRSELARETGLAPEQVAALLAEALGTERVVEAGAERWISGSARAELEKRLIESLSDFHAREPLRPGMPRSTLRGVLPENTAAGAFEAILSQLERSGRLTIEEKDVRLADFAPILTQRQEAVAAQLRADAMIAGLEPKSLREQCAELGSDEAELRPILSHLERDGSLTRAPGDLWFDRGAVDELREKLVAHLREHGAIGTQPYKDLIGTSRKWAVPLMELFDSEHLTVRRGEERVLRRSGSQRPD